jgi:hypothetical protein
MVAAVGVLQRTVGRLGGGRRAEKNRIIFLTSLLRACMHVPLILGAFACGQSFYSLLL